MIEKGGRNLGGLVSDTADVSGALVHFYPLIWRKGLFLSLGLTVILAAFFSLVYFQVLSADSLKNYSSLDFGLVSTAAQNTYYSQKQALAYQTFPQIEILNSKKIVIDISEQMFYCYEGEELIKKFVTSTGKPSTPTKIGSFKVLDKYRMAYGGANGQYWAMPYWLGIYYAGNTENGIHALPYINGVKESTRSLGRMVSHGCIRLADENAVWVYNWADIGTPVVVQW